MDLCSLHSNSTNQVQIFLRTSLSWKSATCNSRNLGFLKAEDDNIFEVRVCKGMASAFSPLKHHLSNFVLMARKNRGNSSSPGNADESGQGEDGSKENSSEGNKSNDSSRRSNRKVRDWREVRASLYMQEQTENTSVSLTQRWAHPISVPETGCILIATKKLDGVHAFKRSVVLLLRAGTKRSNDGPFGLVLNHPLLSKTAAHIGRGIPQRFADCPLYFGGPLDSTIFLLQNQGGFYSPLEEVLPGLVFGAVDDLEEACRPDKRGAPLAAWDNPRFFIGYARWQAGQLEEEIESDYWYMAACSRGMVCGPDPGPDLWYETLQLMGGRYSELGRKPTDS